MSEPLLTKMDRDSAAWKKIDQYIDERIAKLRTENDGDLTKKQTQKVRGRIQELKELKKLGADPKILLDDNEFFKD